MALLTENCPRCGAKKITFDVIAQQYRFTNYDWQNWYEIFSICRSCSLTTVFLAGLKSYEHRSVFYKDNGLVIYKEDLAKYFDINGYISVKDQNSVRPPDYLPDKIKGAFNEGATCLTIGCYNAAATMFRLSVDFATKPLLPESIDSSKPQPNEKQRRDLGLRLAWLFDNGGLPQSLKELAKCIREDANDGAHAGNLSKTEAEDVLDFTVALLERLITEPTKLRIAEERRNERRKS